MFNYNVLDDYMDMFEGPTTNSTAFDSNSTAPSFNNEGDNNKESDNTSIKVSSDEVSINNKVKIENPNLNLNNPNINVEIPGVLPAILGGVAIKAGLELSKHVPTIGGKIAVTAATAEIVAGVTSLGQKSGTNVADTVSKADSGTSLNKIFSDLNLDFTFSKGKLTGLDDYPLNLIRDMLVINSSAILFLFLILNVYIAITIKNNNINIFNYLPKYFDPNVNKLGKLIQYLLNRYIRIWYESRKFILIFSWCMLLIGLLTIQFGLLIISHSG
jgi:hypothetical protein